MIQQRTINAPLHAVYRDGTLVGAFLELADAEAYEAHLTREAFVADTALVEPTPLYGHAADAATVDLFNAECDETREALL